MSGFRDWLRTALADARRVRQREGVSIRQQLREIASFRRRIRIRRYEYYFYRLYEQRRPMAERLEYLAHADRVRLEHLFNPKGHRGGHLGGKIAVKARFERAGIPVPATIGWIGAPRPGGEDVPRRLESAAALRAAIDESGGSGVVCKLDRGYGGQGILIFPRRDRESLIHQDGSRWTIEQLFQHLSGAGISWLLEERVVPHADLAGLCQNGLGTVRILSMWMDDGAIETGFAMYKIPLDPTGADNFGLGNPAAPVNLETGALGLAITWDDDQTLAIHPQTGAPIAGFVLPCWPEVRALVRRAAAQLPGLRSLGWDIGIGVGGPVVIEANASWAEEMQRALHHGLVRGPFAELIRQVGAGRILQNRVP